MKLTRRNFVQILGAAAAITTVDGCLNSALGQNSALANLSAIPAAGKSHTLLSMNADQARAFIGRAFVVKASDGVSTEIILSEVNKINRRANSARGYSGECFSLIFKSRRNPPFAQGIYEMQSAGVDQFSALLVPTGRRGREYELVVNRLKG
jgi:hypothetical protein